MDQGTVQGLDPWFNQTTNLSNHELNPLVNTKIWPSNGGGYSMRVRLIRAEEVVYDNDTPVLIPGATVELADVAAITKLRDELNRVLAYRERLLKERPNERY